MNAPPLPQERRIICVGNRYLPSDDLGPRVYDRLLQRGDLPPDVSLIDGGIAGLGLLRFVEGARRVVFVDALQGFSGPGQAVVLRDGAALPEGAVAYGHDGGLAYLLQVLPAACSGKPPQVVLVGSEPPADEALVARLADLAFEAATEPGERETIA